MDTPDSITLKRCTKCGEEKPHDRFHKHIRMKDGLSTICRDCHKSAATGRRRAEGISPRTYLDSAAVAKLCPKCGETKLREHFYKNKATRDGLTSWCKTCSKSAETAKRRANGVFPRTYLDPLAEGKTCSRCGQYKLREQFDYDNTKRTGMSSRCRACNRAYERAHAITHAKELTERHRAYRAKNIERLREYNRDYYASHKDERREYRSANAKRIAAFQHEYYLVYKVTHAEHLREYRRFLSATPKRKEDRRAAYHRRRARQKGNGGNCTTADLAAIRAAQTDKQGRLICWKCGKPIIDTPHLDHWIPLKYGGSSDAGNMHYMHAKCNLTKGSSHPSESGRLL